MAMPTDAADDNSESAESEPEVREVEEGESDVVPIPSSPQPDDCPTPTSSARPTPPPGAVQAAEHPVLFAVREPTPPTSAPGVGPDSAAAESSHRPSKCARLTPPVPCVHVPCDTPTGSSPSNTQAQQLATALSRLSPEERARVPNTPKAGAAASTSSSRIPSTSSLRQPTGTGSSEVRTVGQFT